MKQQNRKTENEIVNLELIKNTNLQFQASFELTDLVSTHKVELKDFVSLFNEYQQAKINEEAAKGKRQKATEEL